MFKLNSRLLIVDDMATMRKMVAKVCNEIGFTDITEAEDGAKAWEIIQGSHPPIDLILSDWLMPVCNGVDLVKRIRGDGRFRSTPFIMITTESEPQQVVDALRAGVDSYVVKPCTIAVLTEKLEATFKKRA